MADAGFKLAVEGEKEFKAALREIDAQIKVNRSEIKLLTTEYQSNDNGIDELVTKQKVLSDTMNLQSAKVETLTEMYQKNLDAYGETDARVLKLKTSLLDASTALAKTSAEFEDNERAIEDYNATIEATQIAFGDTVTDASTLKNAFADLDAQINANSAEIKTLTAEYQNNIKQSGSLADKQNSLKKQNDVLNDSVTAQNKKIEILNAEMKVAIDRYGEQSKEVSDYRKQIADATGTLQDMTMQINKNADALENSGGSGNSLNDILGKISEKTGIAIPEGISNMIGGLDMATAGAGALAGAMLKVAEKVGEITKESAARADDLITESTIMGIDLKTLQELEFVAPLVDTSVDTIKDALKKLKVGMKEAQDGNEEWVKKFKQMGVQIEDTNGNLLDSYDVFKELVKRYESVDNATYQSALMQDMFGESAENLLPLVKAGSAALDEYTQMAHDLGYVIEDDALNSLGQLNNKFDVIGKTLEGAKMHLADFVLSLFSFDLGQIGDAASGLWSSIKGIFSAATKPVNQYATGTYNHPGGMALVGENGPEIVDLPMGAKVYPNGVVPNNMGSYNMFNITISAANVQEFNDIIRIAQSQRQSTRMGYVG